jgi:prepilin-type N-terminal cleavage/methylation domain-containing protein
MELEFKKYVSGISATCRRSRLSKPLTSMENPKRFPIYQGIKTAFGSRDLAQICPSMPQKRSKVQPGLADNLCVFSRIMKKRGRMLNQKGFTLIEIIVVLVIMSILAGAGMKKLESLSDSASKQTLNHAVRELNSKEALTWALVKVSDESWVSDEALFAKINANLGEGYSWSPGPVLTGGTLRMRSSAVTMARTPSTANTAGNWEIK